MHGCAGEKHGGQLFYNCHASGGCGGKGRGQIGRGLFVRDLHVVSVVHISVHLMSLFVTVHTNTPILCFSNYNYLLVMG